MTQNLLEGFPTIYPDLVYRDPRAALVWLERAFGFQKVMEVPTSDGGILHAEMRFGTGMIILDAAQEQDNLHSPQDLPEANQPLTAFTFVYVADPDAHYARAKAAGAHIISELTNTAYGARGYAARDLEGHLWGFSTYRPMLR